MTVNRIAFLVVAVALLGATATPAILSVDGRVTTADGTGLTHASVELRPIRSRDDVAALAQAGAAGAVGSEPVAAARIDSQGYFRLIAPAVGMWKVRVRAEGYVAMEYPLLPLLESVDLPTVSPRVGTAAPLKGPRRKHRGWVAVEISDPTQAPGVARKNQVRTVTIQGRIVDRFSRQGVAGAYVWPRRDAAAFTRTDGQGRYTLAVPEAPQTTHLQAAATGYLPQRVEVAPSENSRRGPTLALQPAAVVSGRVVDEAGQPLARTEIHGSQTMTRTDLRGRFRLAPIATARPVKLTLTKEDFVPGVEILSGLKPGETHTGLEIVLRQGRTVRGEVIDEQEKPILGAKATLVGLHAVGVDEDFPLMSRGSQSDLMAVTDTRGIFQLDNVPIGSHELKVERAGFAPMTVRSLEIMQGKGSLDLETIVLAPGATVSGIVTDHRGGALADATVYVARSSPRPLPGPFVRVAATSAADGHFTVQDLTSGAKIDLQVRRLGYLPVSVLAVEAPTSAPLDIAMEPASLVSGQVVDTHGNAIEAARVWIRSEAGPRSIPVSLDPALTDREGGFSLTEVDPGRGLLHVSANGFLPNAPRPVEVLPGDEITDLKIVLKKGEATIQGQVLGPGGQPRGSVRVLSSAVSDLTDGDGFFSLVGVATGHRTVTAVSGSGFSQLSRSLEVEPGINTLDLVFEGYPVTGHVLDSAGEPIAGASIKFQRSAEGVGSFSALSSTDGSFDLQEVADGRYRVFVKKEGFAGGDAGREINVDGAPVSGVELRLDAGGALVGRLLGVDSEQLPAVSVSARNRVTRVEGTVAYDGEYRIPHLVPGDWSVTAQLAEDIVEERIHLEAGALETVLDLELGRGLTLTGQVLSGNEPLARARISLFSSDRTVPRFASTDHLGEFRFRDLDSGTYLVGVAGHLEEVDVAGDRNVLIEISTAAVNGWVMDSSTSMPIEGAKLSLDPATTPGTGGPPDATTDSDGQFAWSRVTEGSYQLVAWKEGYASVEQIVEVSSGGRSIEIAMTSTQGLDLQLTLYPFPSHLYAAALDGAGRSRSLERATPNSEGRVRLRSIPANTRELLVAAPGKATTRVAIQVPPQGDEWTEPVAVPVALPPEAWLELVVSELDATNVAADLTLKSATGKTWQTLSWGSLQQEWQLRSGRVTVAGLPAGTWSLEVTAADGRAWGSVVNTLSGAVARVTVE